MANEVGRPAAEDRVPSIEPTLDGPALDGARMDRQAVAKGFAWTALFSLVAKVVFPLAGLYVTRTLGPAILGVYTMLQTTLMIGDVIRDAGLAQSYMAEKDLTREKEASYAGLSLITGLVTALIVLASTPLMARFFATPELIWALPLVSLCLLIMSVGTIPNARLLRKGELKKVGSIQVASAGIALAATIVLVALGVGFPALVTQMVLYCVVGFVLLVRVEPLPTWRAERGAVLDVFRRSRALFGANLLNNLFLFSDIFVIKKLVGKFDAGLYSTAQNLAYKPADLISFPLTKTLQVAFSQSSGDLPRLAQAYYRSLAAIVLFVLPVYVFLGLGGETIIRLLLTPDFLGSIPVLAALCVYLTFRTLGNVSGNALVPAGRHAWTLYPWIVALVFTGVGVAWVSQRPTLMGIVWVYVLGAALVYGLITVIALWFIRGTPELYGRVGRAAGTSALTSAAMFGAFQLPLPHAARFSIAALVGLAMHLAVVGTLYGTGTFSFLSRDGIREVWRRL